MTRSDLAFHIFVAGGGIVASLFMILQTYGMVSGRSIHRRHGKKPMTPHDEPILYWSLVGWITVCTIGIVYGTFLMLADIF